MSTTSTTMKLAGGISLVLLAMLMCLAMFFNIPTLWFVVDVLVIAVCGVVGVTMLTRR